MAKKTITTTPTYFLDGSNKPERKHLKGHKTTKISDDTIVQFSAFVPTNAQKLSDFVANFNERIALGDLYTNRVESKTAFTHLFGAKRSAISAACDRITSCNIKLVGRPSAYNGEIRAKGRIRDIRKLVPNLDLHGVDIDGVTYRIRSGAHEIAAQPGTIVGLNGIDNVPLARPHFRKLELKSGGRLVATHGAMAAGDVAKPFSPLDLMPIYNVPNTTGKGQKIGIIALGGGWDNKDAQDYVDKVLKLKGKKVKVNVVLVDGARNRPDPGGADVETGLDVDGSLGAYDAVITIYLAPNSDTGFAHGIAKAIDDGCTIITISWGSAEVNWTAQGTAAMHVEFQRAQLKGVSVFAAAGDNLAPDSVDDGKVHADYPSSDTAVMSMIGLWLSFDGKTARMWANPNDPRGPSGTGGGVGNQPRQSWETLDQAHLDDGERRHVVGGLAYPGDPATGLIVISGGQQMGVGGTSADGPIAAGHTARANEVLGRSLGFFLPLVAANRSKLCRIVSEGNNAAPGGKGYDLDKIAYGMLNVGALIEMVKKSA
jgi:kumamolisin